MTEPWFQADDGRRLTVVPGFRDAVLNAVTQHTPRPWWTLEDYRQAARKRIARGDRVVSRLRAAGAQLEGARVLEVGTGSGLDTVRLALEGVELAVGVDRDLVLFGRGQRARMVRRLARRTLARLGLGRDIEAALASLPVRLASMNAHWLAFPAASFDIVWSRTTLEHLSPLRDALGEIARVLAPGGIAYHAIDPYFWVLGCHRRGVIDIPWAHARLSTREIERYYAENNSPGRAERMRQGLDELNHLTPAAWRDALGRGGLELIDWRVTRFPWVEELLARHPEAVTDLLPGVSPKDLTACHIEVILKAPQRSPPPAADSLRPGATARAGESSRLA